MPQHHKGILITAGTKRLGLRFAQTTIAMGYKAILHYRSSLQPARQWLRRNPHIADNIFFIRHDLNDSPETVIKKALELPCTLTGLVNNASIFSPGDCTDVTHLQQMIDIHLVVPTRLGSFFYENIKKGWIINIIDAMIDRPNTTYQNYRMSKLFLRELTRQQAVRFAPAIRVNGLAPGAMMPAVDNDRSTFRSLAKKIPLKKTSSIKSLMSAYKFLIENRECTGQIISIDGGWNLIA